MRLLRQATSNIDVRRRRIRRVLPVVGVGLVIAAAVFLLNEDQARIPEGAARPNRQMAFDRIVAHRDQVLQPITARQSLTQNWEVGALDFGQGLAFGEIEDIAVDGIGRVYVLDRIESRLVVLDSTGRVMQTIGRSGRGPGELAVPEAVAVSNTNEVFMWDIGNQRVTRLRWFGDSLALTHEIKVVSNAWDMCVFSDAIIFVDYKTDGLFQEFTHDGVFVKSFGRSLAYDYPSLANQTAHGRVLCTADQRSVIAVSHWLPDVTAYGRDGQVLWSTSLPDFQVIDFRPHGSNIVISMPMVGFYDHILEVGQWRGDTVFVQVGTIGREFRGPPEQAPDWATYLFDANVRDTVLVVSDLPRLSMIKGSRAIGMGMGLAPMVLQYSLGPGGRR